MKWQPVNHRRIKIAPTNICHFVFSSIIFKLCFVYNVKVFFFCGHLKKEEKKHNIWRAVYETKIECLIFRRLFPIRQLAQITEIQFQFMIVSLNGILVMHPFLEHKSTAMMTKQGNRHFEFVARHNKFRWK